MLGEVQEAKNMPDKDTNSIFEGKNESLQDIKRDWSHLFSSSFHLPEPTSEGIVRPVMPPC